MTRTTIFRLAAVVAIAALALAACGQQSPDLIGQQVQVQAQASALAAAITATADAPYIPLRVTQTAQAVSFANATATAGVAHETATVAAGLTVTAESKTATAAANASATATAAIPTQTAQALFAEQQAIANQQAELELQQSRDTYLVKTWLPWIVAVATLILIVAFLVAAYIRFTPRLESLLSAVELRLRTFYGKDGSPTHVMPDDEPVNAIAPNRMLHPALHVGLNGKAVAGGGASDERIQDRVAARAQAAVVMANMPPRLPRRARVAGLAAGGSASLINDEQEILDAQVREVPDHGEIAGWINEVESKMLLPDPATPGETP